MGYMTAVVRLDVPQCLQRTKQGSLRGSNSALPCFEVKLVQLALFLLGLLGIGRQAHALALAVEHLGTQGVDNIGARIQKRIEEELSSVRVLGLTKVTQEEG